MSGILTLIPTPIDDEGSLAQETFQFLLEQATKHITSSIFVIEDLKPGRRRWLRWGLPRDVVNNFYQYNEHSSTEDVEEFVKLLKSGKNLFLMSDGGMPAFCDPGRTLIERCHDLQIEVTSLPLYNSVILALALSGFNHRSFHFEGFLPRKRDEREVFCRNMFKIPTTLVLMDTPYRMIRLLEELREASRAVKIERRCFLATDLTTANQCYWRGTPQQILQDLREKERREFVLIIEGIERS